MLREAGREDLLDELPEDPFAALTRPGLTPAVAPLHPRSMPIGRQRDVRLFRF